MQTFSELPLSQELLRAIAGLGFQTPSPIQQEALPLLLGERTDFVGLAGTGTGKTAAFAIPLLERIDPSVKAVQALILCPTRELAMQVAEQVSLLGRYKRVRTAVIYGGSSYADQIHALRSGANVVIGTPGRVIDHLERNTLVLDSVKTLVLDEADEMFSMGFKEELDTILEGVSGEECNTWLFSATMSREVRRIAEEYLREPQTVQVNRTEMLSAGVEQYYYKCKEFEKPEMICRLIDGADEFYGLIFCQTKSLVADLTRYLLDRGYKADCLHGDKDQTSREHTMQAFRDRKVQIMVCTDVAARGLDVKDVTHVVNYSLPREMENYVHRIGRTARSGKTGIVMNLVTLSHKQLISRIEYHTKVRMQEGFVPTAREIGAKKVSKLLPEFEHQPFHTRVLEVMGENWKERLAKMSSEQVAAHFIAMMMPDIFGVPGRRPTERPQVTEATQVAAKPRNTAAPVEAPVQSPYAAKAKAAPVPKATPAMKPKARKPANEDGPMVFDVPDYKAKPSRDSRKSFDKPYGKSSGKPAGKPNFAKSPRHAAGPQRSANNAELPTLNRRARRAAKFGHQANQASK